MLLECRCMSAMPPFSDRCKKEKILKQVRKHLSQACVTDTHCFVYTQKNFDYSEADLSPYQVHKISL